MQAPNQFQQAIRTMLVGPNIVRLELVLRELLLAGRRRVSSQAMHGILQIVDDNHRITIARARDHLFQLRQQSVDLYDVVDRLHIQPGIQEAVGLRVEPMAEHSSNKTALITLVGVRGAVQIEYVAGGTAHLDRQQRKGDQIGDEQSRMVGRIAEHVVNVIGRQTALTELVECRERRGRLDRELSTQPGDYRLLVEHRISADPITIDQLEKVCMTGGCPASAAVIRWPASRRKWPQKRGKAKSLKMSGIESGRESGKIDLRPNG